jgi:hypothetical protein
MRVDGETKPIAALVANAIELWQENVVACRNDQLSVLESQWDFPPNF